MSDRGGLVADLVAGITVALVAVPQSLAYAELAGMPPHHGLYAAAVPPLAAAFFASSPWLQTGPVALTSLLTFGALANLATPASPEYVGLAAILALVVGVTRVAIGLLKGGAVTYLMSMPVLRGFTVAAALLIFFSQVPAALGVAGAGNGVVPDAITALSEPGAWEWGSLAFTALTLTLVLGGRKVHPLFPGVLVAMLVALGLSVGIGYSGATVGAIPAGLPPFSLALPWDRLPELILPGMVIALVGYAEAASIAQAFAEHEGTTWDPNQEFVSQGVANVAAGVVTGFPVGGSFSRSAVNHLAGAQTRWSGLVTGVAVLAVLPVAALLSPLPRAVLGAIVIAAVRSLLKVKPLLELWALSKPQFVLGIGTFVLTLVMAPRIELAVVAGVGGAVALHLWREREVVLQTHRDGAVLRVRPFGVVWFGSAPALRQAISDALAEADTERLELDFSGLGRLDLSGALVVQALVVLAEARGTDVVLLDVPPPLTRVLDRILPDIERATSS
jgi:SulP family sulfate permease